MKNKMIGFITNLLLIIVLTTLMSLSFAESKNIGTDLSKYINNSTIVMEYQDSKINDDLGFLYLLGNIDENNKYQLKLTFIPMQGDFESYKGYLYFYDYVNDYITIYDWDNDKILYSDLLLGSKKGELYGN